MNEKTVITEKGEFFESEAAVSEGVFDTPKTDEKNAEIPQANIPENQSESAPKKSKKKAQKRDENGRFVKGNKPPKSTGRPKKDRELLNELSKLGPKAAREVSRILNSPKSSDKLKFEVSKWVIEMQIGKPRQQVEAKVDGDMKNTLTVEFTGDLGEWSE